MNRRTCIIGSLGLIAMIIGLFLTLGAAEQSVGPMAVVSVEKIFQTCKRGQVYQEQTREQRDKIQAELQALNKEIEDKTSEIQALKKGSKEHLALSKEIITRQATLQAQRQFYQQQMEMQEKQVVEQLYQDILTATAEIAKEKHIALVFEQSEPQFPAPSSNDLTLTISSHKVLYRSPQILDLTDAVIAELDAKM